MAVYKQEEYGTFQARFQVDGKRYKKTFKLKKDATAWEARIRSEIHSGKEPPLKNDIRRLPALIDLWFDAHGHTLKDGARRKSRLMYVSKLMGNPLGIHVTPNFFAQYRQMRLASGIKENSCNHDLTHLKGLFNELIRQELWRCNNPLKNVRPLKFDETEMHFLSKVEIKTLLDECERSSAKHLLYVVKLCLATGARWNEANKLDRKNIQMHNGRAWVIYTATKNRKNRRIPLDIELAKEFLGNGNKTGKLFVDCTSQFRRVIERTGIQLPRGQMTHVLRHTFASHFMMNGGDILKLQHLLGHATLTMTLRYAHLAPDALDTATNLNPLSLFSKD